MSIIEEGKTYRLSHSRLGNAIVLVKDISDEWVDIEVVEGTLQGLGDTWSLGDKKSVRRSHCNFSEIKET